MNVFLTIDVESYSGDYEAEVYGNGLGLPFILDACRRHNVGATFFVEALGATQWGDAGVRRICRDISSHQQDIQLHIHPSVAKVEGVKECRDLFWALDGEIQEKLLKAGLSILKKCGAPDVSAFRAGDLAADAVTLTAMERVGIRIGSNRDLDGKSSIRSKLNHAFPVVNDVSVLNGQIDLPVSVMRSPLPFLDGEVRHFEISALGSAEMMNGLRQLRKAGYATATILTHPGEFFRQVNGRFVPIQKNCRRWNALLESLSREPRNTARVVAECADRPFPAHSPLIPMFNPFLSLMRVVAQARHRIWARRTGVRP